MCTTKNNWAWTQGDTAVALQIAAAGHSSEEIAAHHGRAAYVVQQRLRAYRACKDGAI